MNKIKKIFGLLLIFTLLVAASVEAKSRKNDEKRFQLGFGFTASSASVFNFIQSFRMINHGEYGVMTQDGTGKNLTQSTKQAMITSNMISAMQVGFQMRILAHIFFSELDLIAQPVDNIETSRCDFMVMYDVGIRCPKWIMPYFAVGANFTMSMYPDEVKKIDKWRSNSTDNIFANNILDGAPNLMWMFGIHAKIGLDVKFKHFSVGCYAMYQVKDISDFDYRLKHYFTNCSLADGDVAKGVGLMLANQCVFGASICWYCF